VILQLTHWRVAFWVVAALGIVMSVCVLIAVPESLPAERRHGGGLQSFVSAGREVLGQRRYVGYLVSAGSAMGVVFAYVATSAFVLQSMNGMSPIAYSIDFAANALGMTLAAYFASTMAGKLSTRRIILTGQITSLSAGVVMFIGAVAFGTPLLLAIVCFLVLMTAQGLIGPNSGALCIRRGSGLSRNRIGHARLRAVGRRRSQSAHRRTRRCLHGRADGSPRDHRGCGVHGRAARARSTM
jgi:DHA1 family bicyclomycin/chloramphenicol resistance-like MFS transporter